MPPGASTGSRSARWLDEEVSQPYHHGHLRAAVLERAAVVVAADGPHRLTLRALASDLGVSHTAPRHHFGSRTGLLTALAAEGFDRLGDRLRDTRESGGSFLDLGVTYVTFAAEYPGHFQVMFAPGLLAEDDDDLVAARDRTLAELTGGGDRLVSDGRADDAGSAVLAGWALVHGLATLAQSGNLERRGIRQLVADDDLDALTRRTAGLLFGPPASGS